MHKRLLIYAILLLLIYSTTGSLHEDVEPEILSSNDYQQFLNSDVNFRFAEVTPEIVNSDGTPDSVSSSSSSSNSDDNKKPLYIDHSESLHRFRFAEKNTKGNELNSNYIQPEFLNPNKRDDMRFSEIMMGVGEGEGGEGNAAEGGAGKTGAKGAASNGPKYPLGVKPVPARKKIIYNYYPYESYQPAYRSGYFYDPWVHHPLGPVPMNANPRSPTSRYQIQPFYYQRSSPNFQPTLYGYPQSDAKFSQTGDNYPYYLPYG